jgi:hypothetical protein
MKNKLYKVVWNSGLTTLVINADENKALKQLESSGIVTLEEVGTFKTTEELDALKKKALSGEDKKQKDKQK